MWAPSDGNEIKKAIKRINKIQLSKFSEDLLFKILFTNSFPPQKNLSADEFLDLKINWLIKNERVEDLENLLEEISIELNNTILRLNNTIIESKQNR